MQDIAPLFLHSNYKYYLTTTLPTAVAVRTT